MVRVLISYPSIYCLSDHITRNKLIYPSPKSDRKLSESIFYKVLHVVTWLQ